MHCPRTPTPTTLLVLLLVLGGCGSAAPQGEPRTRPDTPAEALAKVGFGPGFELDLDLTAGESRDLAFSVETESYLQLVVEQRSLDVVVRVLDGRGNPVVTVDGSGGIGIDERLAARLAAGAHRLRLTPQPDGPARGRVRLRVEALRPFEASDSERLRWIEVGQEATHLDGSRARGDWDRSLALSAEELEGWKGLGDTPGMIRALVRLTSLERELGPLEASIEHGREAVRLALETGSDEAEARSRYWLAQSFDRAGRPEECRRQLELGLAAAERAGDLALQGRILNIQGRLADRANDLLEARRLQTRALELRQRAHDTRGIRALYNNLALVAEELGELALAVEQYRRSIEEADRLGKPVEGLVVRSNLASLLVRRGQWQEALDSLTAGLEVARSIDSPKEESALATQLAHALLSLGEPEPARALLLRALELDRARNETSSEAAVLISLGQLELGLGNLGVAESYLQEALELSVVRELLDQKNWATRNLAALRRAQGRPDLALDLLLPVADEVRDVGQPINEAKALRGLAEVYLDLRRPDAAMESLDLAQAALGPLTVPEIRFELAFLRARALYAAGDLDTSVAEVEGALARLEELRLSVDDPDLRATFLARVRETFDFAVARLLELHRARPTEGFDRRAFATFERGRARSLVEMLSRARAGAEGDLDPTLLENERSAQGAVASSSRRLDAALAAGRMDDAERLRDDVVRARQRLQAAESVLRQAAPEYARLRFAEGSAVEDVQAVLDPGVFLIEFSLGPEGSVAFVLDADGFDIVELAAEEHIATTAGRFRAALTSPSRRAFQSLQRQARALGDLVIAPLRHLLHGATHLIIVPDGALSYIPFEALRLAGDTDDDTYLIERWILSYAGSGGVLRSLARDEQAAARGSGVVAFADPSTPGHVPAMMSATGVEAPISWLPLPGARREVAAIARALGAAETTTYVGGEASESALKSDPRVRRARWLHIAAHAQIDERTPANSSIVLSPAAADDGYLTVQEIFGLDLAAELVVLSGCETALGRQIRGEGLIGLTRAFLYAGVNGLQVSLWKVADDATPALMADFYAGLSGDLPPARALRAAKLASLADARRAHPFYWAPFVLIGS